MAEFGLFVGWGGPVRGRESKAATVFNEAAEFWGRQQQQGEIESWEAVFLEPHGGDLAGFFLIRGERDKLARIRFSDEVLRLNLRAGHIVESFGVVGAELGERIGSSMQEWLSYAEELS
jgi:hypothetical protein